mmetsp:Transcript_66389/g.117882  ORF Transcript_66389/g.117882 Transcript_66389/m.117882 type:complete len:127 (-) Transcript_66389:6-386(-)
MFTDGTEGEAFPVTLTFTQPNWNVLPTFEVRFVNEDMPGGDIAYHVNLTPSSSDDIKYTGVSIYAWATNRGTDAAGVSWIPCPETAPFSTAENQGPQYAGVDTLQFWLHTKPLENFTFVPVFTAMP